MPENIIVNVLLSKNDSCLDIYNVSTNINRTSKVSANILDILQFMIFMKLKINKTNSGNKRDKDIINIIISIYELPRIGKKSGFFPRISYNG